MFGNPGVDELDPAFARANMLIVRKLPGRWNKGAARLYCHRLAEPYLREALRRCQLLGQLDAITTMGCFNFRHQRHDPGLPLSYHSWGIAVDINSDDNRGWYIKQPPECWSSAWRARYPRGVQSRAGQGFRVMRLALGRALERLRRPDAL